jgi:ADP-ribosylglycohydrolase
MPENRSACASDSMMSDSDQHISAAVTRASRRRGCLLGGGIGDALGAPIEFATLADIRRSFGPAGLTDLVPAFDRLGAITDDTQMTMFTAEGLIRAQVRWLDRGICHPPGVVWGAYQRWLLTQGETADPDQTDGWLIRQQLLFARRAPGNTCLSALRDGRMGSPTSIINDSKGCGGVMRVAPVGLLAEDPFGLGNELAALTHTHPSGYLAGGAFALIIARLYAGVALDGALDEAMDTLAREASDDEVLRALQRARDAAENEPATPETIEELGAGWVAEEALAIAVFCSLKAEDFAHGVLLAVNHSGDSDSTGAIAGNILGTMLGEAALPARWVEKLEGADLLRELADDLGEVMTFSSDPMVGEPNGTEVPAAFFEKYPGF